MKKVFGTITLNVFLDVDADSDESALSKANSDFSEPNIEEWNIIPISNDGTVHSVEIKGYKVDFTDVEED